jgi:hypothetical protein
MYFMCQLVTITTTRARICKRLRSPGIDSEKSIPLDYVAWRAGTTNRVVVPARQAGNRFRGSLKRSTNTGSEPSRKEVMQWWSDHQSPYLGSFKETRTRFQPGGPVRQPYFSYRPVGLHRLAKSIPRNRFLGSINVYKYGLWADKLTLSDTVADQKAWNL